MNCNISKQSLQTTWILSACATYLSCRTIAKLTGSSIQTAANHRALADRLKDFNPRLRLYRLPLTEARRIARSI